MNCAAGFILLVLGIYISACWAEVPEIVQEIEIISGNNLSDNGPLTEYVFEKAHKHRSFIPFAIPHSYPWNDSLSFLTDDISWLDDVEEFPPFMTPEQLQQGGVILCFLIGIYCFTLLAIVCDKYFLPSIERLCEVLNISPDVGAATFMAVATSCPELFTNIIATFVIRSELGIGTIVGSSMFNSLGVASIGALAAIRPIKLDWWPVTRDVFIYMLAVAMLVVIVWDSYIFWYEALALFIAYFLYFFVMFQNPRISRFVRRHVDGFKNKTSFEINSEENQTQEGKNGRLKRDSVRVSVIPIPGSHSEDLANSILNNDEHKKSREAATPREIQAEGSKTGDIAERDVNENQVSAFHLDNIKSGHENQEAGHENQEGSEVEVPVVSENQQVNQTGCNGNAGAPVTSFSNSHSGNTENIITLFNNPEEFEKGKEAEKQVKTQANKKGPFVIPEGGWFTKFVFFYTWPLKMILRCTMPNPKTYPNLWPITFLICIFWIGGTSYMVSWMVTVIGDLFGIPPTVQGMTFVAAGGSLPESISIAILSRRGEGKMGVSNALGANTMNILFSLGMPWFFKTILMGTDENAFIVIESGSIVYTILALILVAIILYLTLFLNKFRLHKTTGFILLSIYVICIVLACLSEMVFFNQL